NYNVTFTGGYYQVLPEDMPGNDDKVIDPGEIGGEEIEDGYDEATAGLFENIVVDYDKAWHGFVAPAVLPEGVASVEFSANNGQTQAGVYVVTITFTALDNYGFDIGNDLYSHTYVIERVIIIRAIEIAVEIHYQSSIYGAPIDFDNTEWHITSGAPIGGDTTAIIGIWIELETAPNKDVANNYKINGKWSNKNYNVTFTGGYYQVLPEDMPGNDDKVIDPGEIGGEEIEDGYNVATAGLFENIVVDYDKAWHGFVAPATLPEGVAKVEFSANNGQTEAGSYIVTITFTALNNYGFDIGNNLYSHTYVIERVIVINALEITVNILRQEGVYGQNPTFNNKLWNVAAGVYATGDTLASIKITIICAVKANSDVGNYPITGRWDNKNYHVTFNNNIYVVAPADDEHKLDPDYYLSADGPFKDQVYKYDGKDHEFNYDDLIAGMSELNGNGTTYAGVTVRRDPGSNDITITITAAAGYGFPDGNGGWNKTLTFERKLIIEYNSKVTLTDGDAVVEIPANVGDKIVLPGPIKSNDGYDFVGWKDDKGNVYKPGDIYEIPEGGANLTAVWDKEFALSGMLEFAVIAAAALVGLGLLGILLAVLKRRYNDLDDDPADGKNNPTRRRAID
ncbi:MAG: hypothetical protein LBT55_08100, partial [Clostridiaceae bacterium]|nr:hypothetical protein [Clostridiaceae bacterium]